MAQIRTILSLLAYAPPTLATIFDFELEKKKSCFRFPEVHLKVPKCEIFHLFDFNYFYGLKSLKVGDLRAEIKN